MQASLFLIPVTLGDTDHRRVLPEYNREIILQIKHFIVENIRTARRFLKKTEPSIVIDDLTFYELNKHTSPEDVAGYLVPLTKGEHVGVISEAGCCRSGSGCRCYCAAEELSGGSPGWTVFYINVGNGFRFQRAEFCLSWLSAH